MPMGISCCFDFLCGSWAIFQDFGQERAGVGLCAALGSAQQLFGCTFEHRPPLDALRGEIMFGKRRLKNRVFETPATWSDI